MCTDRFLYGTGQLQLNAYELERCVVLFAKARLVNGEAMVDMIKELLDHEENRLE